MTDRTTTAPSHQPWVSLNPMITSVELEMLEVAVRASDDRLRSLVETVTGYAIITLDPDGIIESWNTGAKRIKGFTPEEALGRHFSMFCPAEDRDTGLPLALLDRARDEGSCEHAGWRVREDDSLFWGDIVISAVHNDRGILTGFVEVVRDLAAVNGFAELIGNAEPENQEHLAERVAPDDNRLLSMVEELVDYARARSGAVGRRPRPGP